MDANNEMMIWYLAYMDRQASRADEALPAVRAINHRPTMRRRLARLCGRAALRVGVWLLAEELRTEPRHAG